MVARSNREWWRFHHRHGRSESGLRTIVSCKWRRAAILSRCAGWVSTDADNIVASAGRNGLLTGTFSVWPLFAAVLRYNEMLLWGASTIFLGWASCYGQWRHGFISIHDQGPCNSSSDRT